MIERVGLTEAANAYPERTSLGMQRRAALARGFILEPDILFMDEPFVSLDDPTAQDLRALLISLWNARPTTVLFVTHDRAEAVMLGTANLAHVDRQCDNYPGRSRASHPGRADRPREGAGRAEAHIPRNVSPSLMTPIV